MRHRRSWFVPAVLAATISVAGLAPGVAAAQEEGAERLTVGRLRLDPCEAVDGAWCGSLRVPFDRADPAAGTIGINFEWYPASHAPAGTVVAVEGGPGYPSTGSRDYYLELFAPVQRTRNLLLVDNRGTGGSALISCRPLQRWHLALGDEEYDRRVTACGEQLNSARRLPGALLVHGSDLYGTANAARDLADVLGALETGPVDLYGDSYGSYFGQTFAARSPQLLRSLTLDATWPVLGTDPFYVSTIETARVAFDLACRRSVACALAVLEHHDNAPLLRLAAKSIYTDDGGPVREWSAGQYTAVSCTDYPQAFDMRAPEPVRRAQYRAAVDALPDDTFAPFTAQEWTASPVAEFDDCIRWPAPVRHDPPITWRPPLVPPTVPVLVLSGGLDTLTGWTDGAIVAGQMGPSARWVKVENTVHVTALGDVDGCASGLVREFVRHPERLATMDTSCASRIPEVRVVGEFPRRLSGATPATPAKGNRAGTAGLKLAAVGAATVGDAIAQWWYLPGSRGHGLRGGWFTGEGDESVSLELHKLRFVADAVVDGTATWSTSTGRVTARVTIKGPHGVTASLRLRWNDLARRSRATVGGRTGSGAHLAATLPAP